MRFIVKGTGAYTTSEGEPMLWNRAIYWCSPIDLAWHDQSRQRAGLLVDIQDRNLGIISAHFAAISGLTMRLSRGAQRKLLCHGCWFAQADCDFARSESPAADALQMRDTIKAVEALSGNEAANPTHSVRVPLPGRQQKQSCWRHSSGAFLTMVAPRPAPPSTCHARVRSLVCADGGKSWSCALKVGSVWPPWMDECIPKVATYGLAASFPLNASTALMVSRHL